MEAWIFRVTIGSETAVRRCSSKEVFLKILKYSQENTQQRCFPVNIVKFSRTAFFLEHLRWLLLIGSPLSIPATKVDLLGDCLATENFCKKGAFLNRLDVLPRMW